MIYLAIISEDNPCTDEPFYIEENQVALYDTHGKRIIVTKEELKNLMKSGEVQPVNLKLDNNEELIRQEVNYDNLCEKFNNKEQLTLHEQEELIIKGLAYIKQLGNKYKWRFYGSLYSLIGMYKRFMNQAEPDKIINIMDERYTSRLSSTDLENLLEKPEFFVSRYLDLDVVNKNFIIQFIFYLGNQQNIDKLLIG